MNKKYLQGSYPDFYIEVPPEFITKLCPSNYILNEISPLFFTVIHASPLYVATHLREIVPLLMTKGSMTFVAGMFFPAYLDHILY
jgi:hypothetical protein